MKLRSIASYAEKIKLIGDILICTIAWRARAKAQFLQWINWPNVMYADVYNYLILMPGMTHEQLKAYKSLKGYNHFVNGWISGVTVTIVPNTKSKIYH